MKTSMKAVSALVASAMFFGGIAVLANADDGRQEVPSDCPIRYTAPTHSHLAEDRSVTYQILSGEGNFTVRFTAIGGNQVFEHTYQVTSGQNLTVQIPEDFNPPVAETGMAHTEVQTFVDDPDGSLNGKCNTTHDEFASTWPTPAPSPSPTIQSSPTVSSTLPAPTGQPTITPTQQLTIGIPATPEISPTLTVSMELPLTPTQPIVTATVTPPPTAMIIPSPTPGKDSEQIAARKVTGWISKETGKLVNWEETSSQPLYVCQGKGGEASVPAMEGLTSDHGRWQFPHQGSLWICEKQNPDSRMQGYTQHPIVLPYGNLNCDRGEFLNAYVGASWDYLKQFEVKWPNPQLAKSFTRDMTGRQACFINILVPNSQVPMITPTSSLGDDTAVMSVTGYDWTQPNK